MNNKKNFRKENKVSIFMIRFIICFVSLSWNFVDILQIIKSDKLQPNLVFRCETHKIAYFFDKMIKVKKSNIELNLFVFQYNKNGNCDKI